MSNGSGSVLLIEQSDREGAAVSIKDFKELLGISTGRIFLTAGVRAPATTSARFEFAFGSEIPPAVTAPRSPFATRLIGSGISPANRGDIRPGKLADELDSVGLRSISRGNEGHGDISKAVDVFEVILNLSSGEADIQHDS